MFLRAMIAPATLALLAALLLFTTTRANAGTEAGSFFQAIDRDGNGLISLSEMVAHRDARVIAVDLNRDGYITRNEFLSGRSLPQDQVNQEAWMQKRSAIFQQMDRNQDGMISPQERQAATQHAFGQYDRDGNGGISLAEIESSQ